MSQGELISRDNERETGSKTRQWEKDWLTNRDNERNIGSQSRIYAFGRLVTKKEASLTSLA